MSINTLESEEIIETLKVTVKPALITVKLPCSYSSSVTVKSDEFSMTAATAAGVTMGSGSLADGFALQLYKDKEETTIADATNVIIGFPLYETMK